MKILELDTEYESLYTDFVSFHKNSLFYYQLKYREILKELLLCNDEYYILLDEDKIRAIYLYFGKTELMAESITRYLILVPMDQFCQRTRNTIGAVKKI